MSKITFELKEFDGEKVLHALIDNEDKDLNLFSENVPDWTLWDALRELTQEVIDEHGMIQLNGSHLVFNTSEEFRKSYLLIGKSTKRGDETKIGQHGEGIKEAVLVLIRLGCKVWMETEDHHTKTVVEFPGPALAANAHDLILSRVLSFDNPKSLPGHILTDKARIGKVYVYGIFTTDYSEYYKTKYGANVHVDLGRDRKIAGTYEFGRSLGDAIVNTKSESIWHDWIDSKDDLLDLANIKSYDLSTSERARVLDFWHRWYGNEAVIETSNDMTREAEHRGANPISLASMSVIQFLLDIGVQTDREYVNEKVANEGWIKVKKNSLSREEKGNLRCAERAAKYLWKRNNNSKLKVFPAIFTDSSTKGLWISLKATMLISQESLSRKGIALNRVVHEMTHAIYGAADNTEDFCQHVTIVAGDLLERAYGV